MGTYEDLKKAIQAVIKTNGNNEITGELLQQTLLAIVNTIGKNATYAGVATPTTNPGSPDQNVIYLAVAPGNYANFNAIALSPGEIAIISNNNGFWEKHTLSPINYTPITYAELVNLRNGGGLFPGYYYRITDYETTTTQANTRAAGHLFDVVVLALSQNELSERAWAVHSERDVDGYFASSNLSAWEIWYALDNDSVRFAWADTNNGKGVIYRMIDEWNNDLPYDFKNIIIVNNYNFQYFQWGTTYQFIRNESIDIVINNTQYYGYTSNSIPSAWNNGNCWLIDEIPSIDSVLYKNDGSVISYGGQIQKVNSVYSENYTFDEANDLNGRSTQNKIQPYLINGKRNINNITFGDNCTGNTFGNNCNSNTFGNNCNSNTFGNNCNNNTFGNNCNNNTFGDSCYSNTFGDSCTGNTFGNNCTGNTFGNNCNSNTFGNNYNNNTFGDSCYSNTFGDRCNNNTFGNNCYSNTFGDSCYSNTFGDRCTGNTFGDSCYSNTFGDSCYSNTFGDRCENSRISSDFAQFNTFGNGVRNIALLNFESGDESNCIQNYRITNGLQGPEGIQVERNRNYETTVGRNSDGTIKQFCVADMIQ